MKVEYHNHFSGFESSQATRVVVYDDFDNPICLVLQIQPGHCRVLRFDDDDFDEQLRAHGVDHTVVVSLVKKR